MRTVKVFVIFCLLALMSSGISVAVVKPWSHGRLQVSANSTYLCHEDGEPFFWLGDTGWLLPERLGRDEAAYYLKRCGDDGYNVVQIQVLNGVPSFNVYGAMSHTEGWNLAAADSIGGYGYCKHPGGTGGNIYRHGVHMGRSRERGPYGL